MKIYFKPNFPGQNNLYFETENLLEQDFLTELGWKAILARASINRTVNKQYKAIVGQSHINKFVTDLKEEYQDNVLLSHIGITHFQLAVLIAFEK